MTSLGRRPLAVFAHLQQQQQQQPPRRSSSLWHRFSWYIAALQTGTATDNFCSLKSLTQFSAGSHRQVKSTHRHSTPPRSPQRWRLRLFWLSFSWQLFFQRLISRTASHTRGCRRADSANERWSKQMNRREFLHRATVSIASVLQSVWL